jgi:hypothetical protein
MLLDRPLSQPEDLLVALSWSALVRPSQEEKITSLIALTVEYYRDPAATLMESNNVHPLKFFNQLVQRGRFVFSQTENVPSRSRPAVLGAERDPGFISSQNLQAVGKTLTGTFL